ncbi:hypothetical protein BGZ74_009054 [Mortierella antarctica]|nr:hypothetical protein BGZ74_009054 [Mortierella antarctica]
MPPVGCIDTLRGFFTPPASTNGSTASRSISTNSVSSSASGIQAPLAIVDMGSNGIRFGIIASLDRHLPVLYEERASISLFEAQFSDAKPASIPQHPAVTPSISNTATIAVMGRSGDDDDDDGDESSSSSSSSGGDDDDHKARLRRTLVANEDDILLLDDHHAPGGENAPPTRQPISDKVINEVVRTFERWQAICLQANVKNVRVIATEATRTAPNSAEFQARIKAATGWDVELLTKAQEANIGALGVMASYHTVRGLFMDLGGGSVQLNYIIRGPNDGAGESSPNAQSWPYGAAALSKRLNHCGHDQAARQAIYDEMVQAFKHGLEDIHVSPLVREDNEQNGGYRMYLSGGGFRGLGYLLMARKTKKKDGTRYPIPVINGYVATGKELAKVVEEYRHLAPEEVQTVFRVSKRRARLIPACATLMAAVMEVIPIRDVYFSEGGVRQGGCFGMLPLGIQNKDPAFETVQSFMRMTGSHQSMHDSDLRALSSFVSSALPSDFARCCLPRTGEGSIQATAENRGTNKDAAELQEFIDSLARLVPILVLVMNCYNHLPKEARSTAAWQLFLPGGALANCYGLTHRDRATLATVLSERHDGDLADPETADAIKKLVPGGKTARQACKYLGKILTLGGLCAPLPGMASLLLSGGPSKHGNGRVSFEQSPSPSTGNGRRRPRDPDRTRVGDEPSDDEHEQDVDGPNDIVVLNASEGGQGHGQVVIRVDKGHPLLEAPNVQDAVRALTEAAAKSHGLNHGVHDQDEGDYGKGKGKKGVKYTD